MTAAVCLVVACLALTAWRGWLRGRELRRSALDLPSNVTPIRPNARRAG